MLVDLTRALNVGDVVPLTFTVEDSRGKRSTFEVKAEVRALAR